MTTPYFNDQAAVDRLLASAASWIGTPFLPFTAVKGEGGGVDCAQLVYALLYEAGAIPAYDFSAEQYAIRSDGPANMAIIVRIVQASGATQIWAGEEDLPDLMTGDILVLTDAKERNHMGVVSSPDKFWHCIKGPGVIESLVEQVEYKPYLAYVWRVFVQENA